MSSKRNADRMYEEFKSMGPMKLSMCYKHNGKALSEIKKEISDHLYESLKIEIDVSRMEDSERFHEGIQNYYDHIIPESKKQFMQLFEEKRTLDKEVKERQVSMLKEIGIITPSTRVMQIMKETEGENFHIFSDMIRYIKLDKKNKTHLRPKEKGIRSTKGLKEMESKLRTNILTILANNL